MASPTRSNSTGPQSFRTGFAITDREFDLFRKLIHQQTGISLSSHKRELVVSRLARRLRDLGLDNFKDYYAYLTEGESGQREMSQMINRITTNKTEFYREAHHFEFMTAEMLPLLLAEKQRQGQKKIRAWSAASSTGEEPYTIAITLAEFFKDYPGWDIKLLATDLDTDVLSHASRGIYDPDRVAPVPRPLLSRYFRQVKANGETAFQVTEALRRMLVFRKFNLHSPTFPFKIDLDFIFCRNVMIYFNNDDKIALMEKFHRVLKPNGHMFVGHSESLMMVRHLFAYKKNTIYQKV